MEQLNKNPNEKVSPTAWVIAYRRTFTDIPYSQNIFKELKKIRGSMGNEDIPDEFKTPEIAPQIEARYKLINKFVRESGITQIFELAAGLSPRGLDMTNNPNINYVESDLQDILSQKKIIINAITNQRSNLHFEPVNALDESTWQNVISHFDQEKPIVVINEGLLRYLNFDQKAIVARNIYTLLKKYGGLWITPDITLKKIVQIENKITSGKVQKVLQTTGVNIDTNCFENIGDAKKFFENLGFSIECHNFMEIIDELVSPQKLGQTRKEVEVLLKNPVVFVMKTT